jgi:hypothetical protein
MYASEPMPLIGSGPTIRAIRRLPIYSVRIDIDWRAVGVMRDDEVIWFWIGPHKEYERLLAQI